MEDKKYNIPFSPPDIGEREVKEVCAALTSGWITTGPRVKQFERELAEFTGVGYSFSGKPRCVCLNSQTACSEMTLRLLGVGEGDEVITTAYTYTASASVVCHVGAKLVLIDTVKDGLNMDYDALEKAITERTKVIIPVDIGGVPCDYDRIFEIAEKKKSLFRPANELQKAFGRVIILADTAHALGTTFKGNKAGSIADFSSFSFHAVKNLTTGEGGALTWKERKGVSDDDIYYKLQLLSLHGQSKDAAAKTKAGAWEYDVVGTWYKCNMTDISAALGLAQLSRYESLLARRKEIVLKYDAAFIPEGIAVRKQYADNYSSSGHLYITRVPWADEKTRNAIITEMANRGIACNVHYKPLPMHTAYKNLGFKIEDFPNAYENYQNEITLPLHTGLKDDEIDYIIENYIAVVKEYKK